MEVPVNFVLYGEDDETTERVPVGNGLVGIDLATENIEPIDTNIVNIVNKLTDHEVDYYITVINRIVDVDLSFMGLLFYDGDSVENYDIRRFYNLMTNRVRNCDAIRDTTCGADGTKIITPDSLASELAGQKRANLFRTDESDIVTLFSGEIANIEMPEPKKVLSDLLLEMLLGDRILKMRGLMLAEGNIRPIVESDSIDIKLRAKISGVNSFESLLEW